MGLPPILTNCHAVDCSTPCGPWVLKVCLPHRVHLIKNKVAHQEIHDDTSVCQTVLDQHRSQRGHIQLMKAIVLRGHRHLGRLPLAASSRSLHSSVLPVPSLPTDPSSGAPHLGCQLLMPGQTHVTAGASQICATVLSTSLKTCWPRGFLGGPTATAGLAFPK